MNCFQPWSPADEERLGGGTTVLLGVLMGVLFIGIPVCILQGWI